MTVLVSEETYNNLASQVENIKVNIANYQSSMDYLNRQLVDYQKMLDDIAIGSDTPPADE